MKNNIATLLVRNVHLICCLILAWSQPCKGGGFGAWTTNQVSTNLFGLSSVVYGNGCYVAAGTYSDYGAIISSEDAHNWKIRAVGGWPPNPSNIPIWGLRVDYSSGHFIGTSAWGGTAVSTNGTNWIFSYAPLISGNTGQGLLDLYGGTYGNGLYVAVGQLESVSGSTVSNIVTSTDGITWTLRRSHPTEARIINDVAYGAGAFVAIGADGYKYRSTTGATWIRTTIPGGFTISFCNGMFMVPSMPGTNLISFDGITFIPTATGLTNQLGKIRFYGGLFLAKSGGYVASSSDGTNWVQYKQPIPNSSSGSYGDIASNGSQLVTVGQELVTLPYLQNFNGFVYTSDNLIGLRLVNSNPTFELLGLVGRSYRVEYTETFADTNSWLTLTNLQLPNNPFTLTDPTAFGVPQRFYRGVLLP